MEITVTFEEQKLYDMTNLICVANEVPFCVDCPCKLANEIGDNGHHCNRNDSPCSVA